MKNILLPLIFLLVVSCNIDNRGPLRPAPTGAPGDLLLVMNDNLWDSYSGDTIRSILAGPVDALPQVEPRFDVIRIDHSGFGKNFKQHRNIIVVKVGADQPKPKILVQKGLWARTQLLITLLAPNEESLIKLLNDDRDKLISLLVNEELKRLMDSYYTIQDKEIVDKLKKEQNIKLNVPKGYEIKADEKDFIWLSQEYRDIVQGILIYTYPYTDVETFTRDYLVAKRNIFLKKYLPGEIEGSYMTTEPLFPPIFSEFTLGNGNYTAQLQGLWRIQDGLSMGGPFVNITQLDEKRNRIVTVEGFVYAPGNDKRDLLQQVEAIIYTLDFTDNQKEQK